MPVAVFSGTYTVPLYQHPFSNPTGRGVNCIGGTVCSTAISTGNGKTGDASTSTGYHQPLAATWRKRKWTQLCNSNNQNINSGAGPVSFFVNKENLMWINPNGLGPYETEASYNLIGCPDGMGTFEGGYPESVSSFTQLGLYPHAALGDPNLSQLMVTLNNKPGVMNYTNRSASGLGFVLTSLDGYFANVFTNLATLADTGDNGLSIVYSCPDFTNDVNYFFNFLSNYPELALIRYNYIGEGHEIVSSDGLSFDNGATWYSNAVNGIGRGGWNESANGYVFTDSDVPLNGVPYTAVFLSRDMTKWYQIILQPQDTASITIFDTFITNGSGRLMQDDQGTWFMTAPIGVTNNVAVSLGPIELPPPSQLVQASWNDLPIAMPCVEIC
jgi:hypothetical protein